MKMTNALISLLEPWDGREQSPGSRSTSRTARGYLAFTYGVLDGRAGHAPSFIKPINHKYFSVLLPKRGPYRRLADHNVACFD
jgi:hypothetical protein